MKEKKDNIVIPKKALIWIAPAIWIIAVLLSKHQTWSMILFLIGIIAWIIIGRSFCNSSKD